MVISYLYTLLKKEASQIKKPKIVCKFTSPGGGEMRGREGRSPEGGGPGRSRTYDLWFRKPMFYPAELQALCNYAVAFLRLRV